MQFSFRTRSVLALAVSGSVSALLGLSRTALGQQNLNEPTVFHSTTVSDSGAANASFNTGGNWNVSSDGVLAAGTAPTAGYAYVITGDAAGLGNFLNTPSTNTNAYSFAGDSITVIPYNGQANLNSNSSSGANQCDQTAVFNLNSTGTTAATANTITVGSAGATTGGLILANGGTIANFGNAVSILNGHINLVPAGVTMDGITTGGVGNPSPSGGIIDTRNNSVLKDYITLNATITGAGLLHVLASGTQGSGFLVMNASNYVVGHETDPVYSFTGGLTLDNTTVFASTTAAGSKNSPTLFIDNPGALGTGTFTIVSTPTTYAPIISNGTGAAETISYNVPMQWNGPFTYGSTGGGAYTFTISPLDLGSGPVTMGANTNINVTASTLSVDGNISASGAYTLTKSGTGALNLSGSSITVPVTVTAGTLNANSTSSNFGSAVTVTGGILNVTSASSTFGGPVTVSGTGSLVFPGAATTFTSSLSVASGATLELTSAPTNTTFSAPVAIPSGATLAVAVGASLFSDSSIGSYLSTLTSSSTPLSVASGATIAFDTTAGNYTLASLINIPTYGLNKIGANTLTLTNTADSFMSLGVTSGTLAFGGTGSFSYNGPVTATGATLVVANPAALANVSVVTLTGSSTLDFATNGSDSAFPINVSSGSTVAFSSDLPTAGAGISHTVGTVTMVGTTASTLNFTAGPNVTSGTATTVINTIVLPSTANLTLSPSTGNVSIGTISVTGGTTHTITLAGTGSGQVTGAIADGPGATSLAKTGAGSWTLSGISTFTGAITMNASPAGIVNLTGQINNAGTLNLGGTSGAAWYQSGTSSNFSLVPAASVGDSVMSNGSLQFGYYGISGGTLTIAGILDDGGPSGTSGSFSRFDVNGGVVNLTSTDTTRGMFTINKNSGTNIGQSSVLNVLGGTMQLSGGALSTADSSQNGISANWSNNDTSVINIGSIGSATPASLLTPNMTVKLNHGSSTTNANGGTGVTSVLNLNGGGLLQTLGFTAPVAANNTGVFINFNGGTLQAGNASNASFIPSGVGSILVYGGGGTVDSNGKNITISQPLVGPTDSGVTGVTFTGGTGYVTPPRVIFPTPAGGAPATGYATINQSGGVTGVVITSPGSGYALAPTPTFASPTGATPPTSPVVNIATNTVGGMTFQGAGGTITLTGSNTYTGLTTVASGTLVLDHSGSNTGSLASPVTILGSGGGTLAVKGVTSLGGGLTTIGSGSTISLNDGAVGTLTVNGGFSLASGSVLNLDIGSSAGSSDMIAASGPGLLTGVSTVNLSGVGVAAGNYVLLTSSGGFTPGNSNLVVGTHPAGRFNSFSFNQSTSTQEILTVSATAFAPTNYWTGAASVIAGDTAYNWSTGSTSSNFSVNQAGTIDQNQVPGPVTDVIFTASNAKPSSGSSLVTNLDSSYAIQGLYFVVPTLASPITSTSINLNANTLTLGSDGLTLSASSLSSGTIGAGSLVLASSQNWANNNNTLGLTVNSNISSGTPGTTLTLNGTGAGNTTLNGVISDGSGPLTMVFEQAGTTALTASNTYTGGSTINSGIVQLGNASALGTGNVTLNAGQIDLAGTSPTFTTLSGSGGTITNSGAATTLTVNGGSYFGTISDGAGQVSLTKTTSSTFVMGGTSSYSGSTNVSAGTLQLGNTNATSPASPVLLSGTLDLNGYSTAVKSLSGTGIVTSSGGSPASLTLSTAVATTFSGAINDGSGAVQLLYSGAGNQTLSGMSTYSGGTNIASGVLTVANNTALGTGTVTLAGGTMALNLPSSGRVVVNGIATGTAATQFKVNIGQPTHYFVGTNGEGTVSAGTLGLTDTTSPSTAGEVSTAFTNSPVAIGPAGFTAQFLYSSSYSTASPPADGIAFVLQNDPAGAGAIEDNGNHLGYVGMQNSVALELNLYSGYTTGTALQNDGTVPVASYTPISPVTLTGLNTPVQTLVTITYNAQAGTITETLNNSSGTYSNTFTGENLSTVLGGNSAYVGFTGATGSFTANQNVSNFTFSELGAGPASIANNVIAAAGTTSSIELHVNSGFVSGGIGSLGIAGGALVKLVSVSTDGIANHGVLTTTGLSIAGSTDAWTGKLDVSNNALDIQTGDIAAITNQLKQGYAGGNWNGTGGITSTSAKNDSTHLTAIGSMLNTIDGSTPLYGASGGLGLFEGVSPAATDVLVKYTYYGDANLDGMVDGSDYSLIDNGFLGNLTGWFNGDFNYDGVINGSDYTLIDNAYNTQGAQISNEIATTTSQLSSTSNAVPEPATMGLMLMTAAGLLGRRCRAKNTGYPRT